MRFFEVTDNTAKGSADPVIIEAISEGFARDIFAREWLGMESWQEALGDGVDNEMFTFTHVNHGPATEFPGQVHLRTPRASSDPQAHAQAMADAHADTLAAKKPAAKVSGLKTFPKPAQKKRRH